MASALALWAAFPPLGWWPLAWIAPIGWCLLVAMEKLDAEKPYRILYAVGLLHCLLVIHWIRLPHWSAYFGWLALSLYLAVYTPLFVGLARILVHRWRWPLLLACPTVWCGLELVRGYLLTGFSMGLLGHTQVAWLRLIQIADVGGAYAVGFAIMFVAAGLAAAGMQARYSWRRALMRLLAIAGMFLSLLAYGQWRWNEWAPTSATGPTVRIGLIQGSRDTKFDASDDPRDTLAQYRELTQAALAARPDLDLIVWPESMHTVPWIDVAADLPRPDDFPGDERHFQEWLAYSTDHCRYEAGWFARQFGKPAVVGCAVLELDQAETNRFNRALSIDAVGNVQGSYDKMHPVMFGEYVPLGNVFPWLYRLTPMGEGLTSGRAPLAVNVNGLVLAPSICFENTVPHLIRRQIRTLEQEGQAPDALLTISNDGWFWGSSQLDMHLACGVFRAVELRKPALIAANTGFSASIDRRGQVLERGPRRQTGYLVAELQCQPDAGACWYREYGDVFSGLCLLVVVVAAVEGGWSRHRGPASERVAPPTP